MKNIPGHGGNQTYDIWNTSPMLCQLSYAVRSVPVCDTYSIVHNVAKATDGNGALVRLVLLDFRKAFDLIDHQLLMVKLHSLDVPPSVKNWVIDFLTNRQQRVKLANDCYSEWSLVSAGVPQETKLGPWLYILMINDLNTVSNSLWKYVDDTTLAEVIPRGGDSNIQSAVDDIQNQSKTLKFTLNEDKCKEIRIQFSRDNTNYQQLPLGTINGKQVDLAFQSKVLGLTISSDLNWNGHIDNIVKKASKRLYFLRQLKRAKVSTTETMCFYCTCIRPIVEYPSPVFHYGIPIYLCKDIERIQRRAMKIIFPTKSYAEALSHSRLLTLEERRQIACDKLFKEIMEDKNHKLHPLLPDPNTDVAYSLRTSRTFKIPKCKTERFKKSFIIAASSNNESSSH